MYPTITEPGCLWMEAKHQFFLKIPRCPNVQERWGTTALTPWHLKSNLQICSIGIFWGLVKNADSHTPTLDKMNHKLQ